MLVVRTELWPFGDEEERETLSVIVIGNDATGSAAVGSYRVWYNEGDIDPYRMLREEPATYVGGHVRSAGHLTLVGKVAKSLGALTRA